MEKKPAPTRAEDGLMVRRLSFWLREAAQVAGENRGLGEKVRKCSHMVCEVIVTSLYLYQMPSKAHHIL